MNSTILKLEHITKSFEQTQVLHGIDLEVPQGAFVTLLGSSGCGKTTMLRIIAGLEDPDGGNVILEGKCVNDLAPNKRDVNTVFQSYALFPHMTVEQNIGYGLKLKKISKSEISRRVQEMLQLVQLEEYGKRTPDELSGGQRQRVAIARAVINQPKVLLLDEPLGALDLQLRRQMQLELKKLQKQLGITFIYITHDQEEALNMSDMICIMRDGIFVQTGSAADIYDRPQTAYVASFVGEANILHGNLIEIKKDQTALVEIAGSHMLVSQNERQTFLQDAAAQVEQANQLNQAGQEQNNQNQQNKDQSDHSSKVRVAVAIRGEQIQIHKRDNDMENSSTHTTEKEQSRISSGLPAQVTEKSFAGGMLRIELRLKDGTKVVAKRHGIDADFSEGDEVTIHWDAAQALLVEDDV